jgi:mono/diheme cytochrome c family protein
MRKDYSHALKVEKQISYDTRMSRRFDPLPLVLVVIGIGLMLILGWFASMRSTKPQTGTALPPIPTLDVASVALGKKKYDERCASCHGVNLEGQPNWKKQLPSGKFLAPPHDDSGHTWHHPDTLLISIIKNGGNGVPGAQSDMPSFKNVLSDQEILAVLEFLKSRWSRESREFQHAMTHQEMSEHK